MPKNFEFVGFRKYDPLALTAGERDYTEGIDYYGGDTQVFLTAPGATLPKRIGCLRNLTGGGLYYDMVDTSCYGQLHKSYMQRQMDSDPIQATISAMSEEAMEIIMNAFLGKRTVQLMVLFPDSRYIQGMVRIERVDPNTAIDSVFEYVVTFRRVHSPLISEGLYSLEYDLQGGTWKNPPTIAPYYQMDETVTLAASTDITPPPSQVFVKYTAYNRVTHEKVDILDPAAPGGPFTIIIKASTVIQANYKLQEAQLLMKAAEQNISKNGRPQGKLPALRGAFPESSEQYPIGTIIALPERPNLAINKHWELVGWTIGDKPYEFGGQYQIMEDTVVTGRWQEMTIMEFSAGANPSGVVPEPIRVEKGERVTVPALAADPEGHYRAVGWRDETRHVTYTPGQKVELTRDMTLTATWKQLHYVKYSVDRAGVEEGSIPVDQTAYEAGESITLPALAYIQKEGYTFAGWERGSGDTHIYQPGEHYAVKPTDGAEIIFDAKWEEV